MVVSFQLKVLKIDCGCAFAKNLIDISVIFLIDDTLSS